MENVYSRFMIWKYTFSLSYGNKSKDNAQQVHQSPVHSNVRHTTLGQGGGFDVDIRNSLGACY